MHRVPESKNPAASPRQRFRVRVDFKRRRALRRRVRRPKVPKEEVEREFLSPGPRHHDLSLSLRRRLLPQAIVCIEYIKQFCDMRIQQYTVTVSVQST